MTDLSPTERLWLYGRVEAALVAEAVRRGIMGGAVNLLEGGCDDTLRAAMTWASERGIAAARIAGALAARGATCDCTVVLRAAADDEHPLGRAIVSGQVVGIPALYDVALVVEREPRPPEPAELIWIERSGDAATIPPQVIAGALIPRLCDVLVTGGTEGRVEVCYPDAGDWVDVIMARSGTVTVAPPDRGR